MTPYTPTPEQVARSKAELAALKEIPLSRVVSDRYGATKDGPERPAFIKKLGRTGQQQKWKLATGHFLNIVDDDYFFDLTNQKGGGGAINLVAHLDNLDFKNAIKSLKATYGHGESLPRPVRPATSPEQTISQAPNELVLPRFPEHNQKVFAYLTEIRKLDPEMVQEMIDMNLVYPSEKTHIEVVKTPASDELIKSMQKLAKEESYRISVSDKKLDDRTGEKRNRKSKHEGEWVESALIMIENRPKFRRLIESAKADPTSPLKVIRESSHVEACFPILDYITQKPIATSIRSLEGSHKQVLGPKSKGAFFTAPIEPGYTKEVVLTESPIEAMAYAQVRKPDDKTVIIGTSGTGGVDPLYPMLRENGITLVMAYNNEMAGRIFGKKERAKAEEAGVTCRDDYPPNGEISIEYQEAPHLNEYASLIIAQADKENKQHKQRTSNGIVRIRVQGSEALWKMLSPTIEDRSAAREAERTKSRRPAIVEFNEESRVDAINKDWNDQLLTPEDPQKRRLFTNQPPEKTVAETPQADANPSIEMDA